VWELLCLRKVDTVVAHGEARTIKVGRGRTTDIHHHALRVAIHVMYDFVFMKKAQSLDVSSAFMAWRGEGGKGVQVADS
jgi:hypothetical protein